MNEKGLEELQRRKKQFEAVKGKIQPELDELTEKVIIHLSSALLTEPVARAIRKSPKR